MSDDESNGNDGMVTHEMFAFAFTFHKLLNLIMKAKIEMARERRRAALRDLNH
jgi:hypothetical protein